MFEIDWSDMITVSHSRIKTWRRCQMQHHYRYYQWLRRKSNAIPLFVGTGVHAMLEAQVVRGDWKTEMESFRSDFNRMFQEEKAELGDIPTEVEGIVKRYFQKYSDDGLSYIPRHRGLRAEIPITVDLDNHTRFIGFVDNFPQDSEGRNWVMDHKTCKTIPNEESRFADLQLLLYVWLLPQLGYPRPDGVIWDYIRKKPPSVPELLKNGTISKAAKIDTTYETYMSTVESLLGKDKLPEYEDFASTLKGRDERFYRRIYLPSPPKEMVGNVVEDIMSSSREIRNLGPNAKVRNMTKDCNFCSYYNLCQAEVRGLDTEYIRKTDYTTKKERDDQEKVLESDTDE